MILCKGALMWECVCTYKHAYMHEGGGPVYVCAHWMFVDAGMCENTPHGEATWALCSKVCVHTFVYDGAHVCPV